MKIINLTPHDINIIGHAVIPASGTLARVSQTRQQISTLNGIPVNRSVFGKITGLPDAKDGTIYLVSLIVLQALGGSRPDCYIVDDSVRDDTGRIIGVNGLAQL